MPLWYRLQYILRGQLRRRRAPLFAMTLLLGILFLLIQTHQVSLRTTLAPKVAAQTNQATATVATAAATTPATPGAPTSAKTSSTVSAVAQTPAPPRCSTASYSAPSQLNLLSAPLGLTQVVDATTYYQVNGYNAAQVRSQLQQCAPSAGGSGVEFAAETGYALSWQYDTVSAGGLCSIANAKVGLHLNMILPSWQATAAGAGYAGVWQQFASSLATHENGHAALDQQFAARLLLSLQTTPPGDCGSLGSIVQARLNADVAALDAANNTYDAATNHGATQGAVIP